MRAAINLTLFFQVCASLHHFIQTNPLNIPTYNIYSFSDEQEKVKKKRNLACWNVMYVIFPCHKQIRLRDATKRNKRGIIRPPQWWYCSYYRTVFIYVIVSPSLIIAMLAIGGGFGPVVQKRGPVPFYICGRWI